MRDDVWIDDVELAGGSSPAEEIEPEEGEAAQPGEAEPDNQPRRRLCGGAGAVLLLPLAAGLVMAGRRRRR